jgi:hypothetical protein
VWNISSGHYQIASTNDFHYLLYHHISSCSCSYVTVTYDLTGKGFGLHPVYTHTRAKTWISLVCHTHKFPGSIFGSPVSVLGEALHLSFGRAAGPNSPGANPPGYLSLPHLEGLRRMDRTSNVTRTPNTFNCRFNN